MLRMAHETLELAHRAGDPQLVAYALTCKAMVRADAGDGIGAVDLAAAALAVDDKLCAKAQVMALQHAAFGHALLGDRAAVDQLLGDIGDLLAGMDNDDYPWGGDRLRRAPDDIVDVQRATCYERLGLAEEAAGLWDRVMRQPAAERRDRGVYLARQAATLLDIGEADGAAHRAMEGLRYLHETGSARMHSEFLRLHDKATRAGSNPVQDVLATMAN
jgi:hypothetical protein